MYAKLQILKSKVVSW